MKLKLAAVAVAALVGNTATAQENLTGATSDTTGVPGMAMLHLGEVAAREGIANLQIASGQTLTNIIQSVAEGSTDVGATPFILAFLLSKGAGPYAAIGAEKGAELAAMSAFSTHIHLAVWVSTRLTVSGLTGGMT